MWCVNITFDFQLLLFFFSLLFRLLQIFSLRRSHYADEPLMWAMRCWCRLRADVHFIFFFHDDIIFFKHFQPPLFISRNIFSSFIFIWLRESMMYAVIIRMPPMVSWWWDDDAEAAEITPMMPFSDGPLISDDGQPASMMMPSFLRCIDDGHAPMYFLCRADIFDYAFDVNITPSWWLFLDARGNITPNTPMHFDTSIIWFHKHFDATFLDDIFISRLNIT